MRTKNVVAPTIAIFLCLFAGGCAYTVPYSPSSLGTSHSFAEHTSYPANLYISDFNSDNFVNVDVANNIDMHVNLSNFGFYLQKDITSTLSKEVIFRNIVKKQADADLLLRGRMEKIKFINNMGVSMRADATLYAEIVSVPNYNPIWSIRLNGWAIAPGGLNADGALDSLRSTFTKSLIEHMLQSSQLQESSLQISTTKAKSSENNISVQNNNNNADTMNLQSKSPKGANKEWQTLVETNQESFVNRSIFGIYVIENDNKEIEIYRVSKQSVTAKSDLRIGDIITRVDDIDITNRSQLFELIYERKNAGDTVDVFIKRRGGLLKKSITPPTDYLMKDLYALLYEITKNEEPIRLAIIVNSLTNMYLEGTTLEKWKEMMKPILGGSLENYYLSFLRPEKNFLLVDREKASIVLSELKLQQSGLIDVTTQQKLGKMLGASHLLLIDFSRSYLSDTEALDMEIHKLIEVKTGKILASVPFKMKTTAK